MSKEEIIKQLQLAEEEFSGFCRCIDGDSFFRQPANKWSVAQNVKHLTISANTTRLAFILPKFILLLYTGKPNRLSRNFNELTNKYKTKLQQGGKASGRYIPATISPQVGKENILDAFSKSMNQLSDCVAKKWTNAQLDQYLAPHPLLGKITLRELCYFTIYHTRHHLEIIKERLHDDIIST